MWLIIALQNRINGITGDIGLAVYIIPYFFSF
jgi:hypothetical protein